MEEEIEEATPAAENSDKKPRFTAKEKLFIQYYPTHFNATKAAKQAGYSAKTACEIGNENLRKPKIANAIKKRLDEIAMSAGEATKRLSDWGRGSFKPFLKVDGEALVFDLTSAQAKRHIYLIKKIKQSKRKIYGQDDIEIGEEVTTEIELYDAMAATVKIAQVHNLLNQKIDLTTNGKDIIPEVRVFTGQAPPLASSEEEIEGY